MLKCNSRRRSNKKELLSLQLKMQLRSSELMKNITMIESRKPFKKKILSWALKMIKKAKELIQLTKLNLSLVVLIFSELLSKKEKIKVLNKRFKTLVA
jgi:hypothetical protein